MDRDTAYQVTTRARQSGTLRVGENAVLIPMRDGNYRVEVALDAPPPDGGLALHVATISSRAKWDDYEIGRHLCHVGIMYEHAGTHTGNSVLRGLFRALLDCLDAHEVARMMQVARLRFAALRVTGPVDYLRIAAAMELHDEEFDRLCDNGLDEVAEENGEQGEYLTVYAALVVSCLETGDDARKIARTRKLVADVRALL